MKRAHKLFAEFQHVAGNNILGGAIKYREDVVEGLENAPKAFLGMLAGKNFGKLLVAIKDVKHAGPAEVS